MAAAARVRVVIADDNPLFRDALDAILAAEPQIDVVGRAADGAEAVDLAVEHSADVVVMDISMPRVDGLDAARAIRAVRPETAVLIVTGSNARADVDRARLAGAAGYLTKDRIAAQLVPAILAVAPR